MTSGYRFIACRLRRHYGSLCRPMQARLTVRRMRRLRTVSTTPEPSHNERQQRRTEHEQRIVLIEQELEAAQKEDRLDTYLKDAPSVHDQILGYLRLR